MIAAAIEPLEILVAGSGLLVLLGLLRRTLAGRPLLRQVERPFRPAPWGQLLLFAAGLFVVYVASIQIVVSGKLGVLSAAVGLAVPLSCAAAVGAHLRRALLLPRGSVAWRIGMGLLHLWGVLPLVLGAFFVCRLFGPEQDVIDLIRKKEPGWQAIALSAVLVAPPVEEICFRGLLYPALRQWLGTLGALLVSSILFAAIHDPWTAWIPLAIFAMALGWLVETTGSIVPSIAAHMAFNAIPVAALVFG